MFDYKPNVVCCKSSYKIQGEMINIRLKFLVLNLAVYSLYWSFELWKVFSVFLFFCVLLALGSALSEWEWTCMFLDPLSKFVWCLWIWLLSESPILHKPLCLVLMPCLHVSLSFLIIVQHEDLGHWRSWIHWISLSWQIDGKWKKWGQLVGFLLIPYNHPIFDKYSSWN